jgi:cell division protease FtsH
MEQYTRARQIIIENKEALIRLAEALLERESLDSLQIRRLVAGLPLDDDEGPAKVKEERPKAEPRPSVLKPIIPPIPGDATA